MNVKEVRNGFLLIIYALFYDAISFRLPSGRFETGVVTDFCNKVQAIKGC